MLNSVEVKILDERLKQMMIGRATGGSAAIDLHACISTNIRIKPGDRRNISSGLSVFIKDPNYCAVVLPRSGLGCTGLVIANTIGLIDSDYQGVIQLSMLNRTGFDDICIEPMQRVAQIVFLPIARPEFNFVEEFTEASARGQGGFGSTGK
jgi:dUTP pyrophosphatase